MYTTEIFSNAISMASSTIERCARLVIIVALKCCKTVVELISLAVKANPSISSFVAELYIICVEVDHIELNSA